MVVVQILDEVVCISHGANILGKFMNPSKYGQIIRQTSMATSQGEGKLNLNLVNSALKIDFVSHLARA